MIKSVLATIGLAVLAHQAYQHYVRYQQLKAENACLRQRHKLNSSFTLYFHKSVNSQNIRIYLHAVEYEAFDFALQYKAFNGIGAIIGVLAKQAGFHLSPHGLTYVKPDAPATEANGLGMLVTRDWRDMLLLFRYSPKQYKQGYDGLFKNPEEAYEFAAHTAYFNKAMFSAPYAMPDSIDMNEQGALAGFMDWVHHPNQADIYQSAEHHHAQLADSVMDRARRQFPDFQAALERGDTESIDIRKAADQVTAQHDRNQLMADAGISSRTTFRTATRWLQREQGGREGLDRWLLSTTYNDLVARLADLKADIEVRKT